MYVLAGSAGSCHAVSGLSMSDAYPCSRSALMQDVLKEPVTSDKSHVTGIPRKRSAQGCTQPDVTVRSL